MAVGRSVSYGFAARLSSSGYSIVIVVLLELGAACGGNGKRMAPNPTPAPDNVGSDAGTPMVSPDDAGMSTVPPGPTTPFTPAPHAPFPQLVRGQGGVFQNPRIVHIIAQNDMLASALTSFTEQMSDGSWWAAAGAEYGVGNAESLHIIGPDIISNLTRTQMEAYIEGVVQQIPDVAPNGSTVYMLYLPDGIVALEDSFYPPKPNNYCHFYNGYHLPFRHGPDNWAFAQRCTLLGSVREQLDALTETATHEIMESATDPIAGFALPTTSTSTPWVDTVWSQYYGGVVENADLCDFSETRVGDFLYQRIFSNNAARAGGDPCVPAVPDTYFSTAAAKGWYAVAPGATVEVPITGWSTGPMTDWVVEAALTGGYAGFTMTLTSSTSTTTPTGDIFTTINNGRSATLRVQAPKNAQRGKTYVVMTVDSYLLSRGSDMLHFWPVGFYVP
jgi:hypothetical protein